MTGGKTTCKKQGGINHEQGSEKGGSGKIRSALSEVPEAHHAEVGKAIVHDIGVMAKAINIVNKRPE
jgi:hypothetical protein